MCKYKYSGIKNKFDETNDATIKAVERVLETKQPEIVELSIDCIVRVLFNEKLNDVQIMYFHPSAVYKVA